MDKITLVVMLLGILIFSSHLFNKMFDRTKVPNVLLLMIIGIIGGFFIDKELFFGELGRVFTTVTLVIILFESGIGLKFSELKTALLSSTLVTIVNFFIVVLIVTGVLTVFTKLDFISIIFIGAILGGTSSAVVIPMVKQLKLGTKSSTVLLLESAFSDVLCLVVGLAALEGIKAGDLNVGSILNTMWQSFLFAALLGLAGGILWSMILNWIRAIKHSMFTTFAFLFIVYGAVELMGFNGGIAALCFGIVLGNSDTIGKTKAWNSIFRFDIAHLNTNEKDFFSEIVFVLQTYFFVYVGVVIEFGSFVTYLIAILIILLALAIRPLVMKIFVRKGVSPKEFTVMSIMSPKGLVPAILASIPLQLGLASGRQIAEIGYAVVLLSIFICSILVIVVSKDPLIFNKMIRKKKKAEEAGVDDLKIEENTEDKNIEDDVTEKPEEETESKITIKKKYKDEFDD
ncbi:MAG TPA: cation:proton antiporter [Bacteroidales bacterium]|nr:cation:proton antiporter [Bacteroidales bacterium]